MPELVGTKYEEQVRELLRLDSYSSIEAKIHDLKMTAALRSVAKLNALGEGYLSIAATLCARKIAKLAGPLKAVRGRSNTAVEIRNNAV
jgi:hypothetical protein